MKFGSHLKAHRTPHWKFNFVDYDGLKAHLKTYTDDREFTEQNEDQFIKMLRSELDKVYTHLLNRPPSLGGSFFFLQTYLQKNTMA